MIKVISNKELFDRWMNLANNLRQFGGSVQNDQLMSEARLAEFKDQFVAWRSETLSVFNDTLQHIMSCNVKIKQDADE